MRRLLLGLWAAALLAGNAPVQAAVRSFDGTVTRVSDGDTLWVRPATGGRPVQLRLVGIDAPEICQAHGHQALQALASQVLRRPVQVQVQATDDYGRLLARVATGGQDVGRAMVERGHAWSYRWRRDRGPYASQEAQARQAQRGLWASGTAMEPRRFRRVHGPCPLPQGRRS